MPRQDQIVIGLCGLAGAGKSTAARILSQKLNFSRRPFAMRLKAMIAAGFDIPADVLDGPASGKEVPLDVLCGKTLRHAMQTLGSEWARGMIGDDVWVRAWLAGSGGIPRIVADDVRFYNEVSAIHSLGGKIIHISRPGAGTLINVGHESEAHASSIPADAFVMNDGDQRALEGALRQIIPLLFDCLTEECSR